MVDPPTLPSLEPCSALWEQHPLKSWNKTLCKHLVSTKKNISFIKLCILSDFNAKSYWLQVCWLIINHHSTSHYQWICMQFEHATKVMTSLVEKIKWATRLKWRGDYLCILEPIIPAFCFFWDPCCCHWSLNASWCYPHKHNEETQQDSSKQLRTCWLWCTITHSLNNMISEWILPLEA